MANSYDYFNSDNRPRLRMYVYYDVTQDIRNNKSTVSVSSIRLAAVDSAAAGYSFTLSGSITIGNTTNSYNGITVYLGQTGSEVQAGDSFGSFEVQHDSSGNGTVDITWNGNFNATANGVTIYWSSGTSWITLPKIDRTAPTVTAAASPTGTGTATVTGTSTVACDAWYVRYKKSTESSYGEWISMTPASNKLSATGTLTGLETGNYNVQVKARKETNYVEGTSSAVTFNMDIPVVTLTITSVGPFSIAFQATTDVSCKAWYYSLDNGTTWTLYDQKTNTYSDVYTITGLSADTTYTIKAKAVSNSNNTEGITSKSQKTVGPTKITSVNNFSIDVASPNTSVAVTPEGSFYYKLYVYDGDMNTLFGTLTPAITASATSFRASLGTTIRDLILATMSTVKTYTLIFVLETFSNSARTTSIGTSRSSTITISTSASRSAPTFTAFTYSDTDTDVVAVTQNDQVLVQGLSNLRVVCTAGTANYQASISAYSVAIGDVAVSSTGTTLDAGVISTYGTLTLAVTCIDSRGYSTTVEKTVTVLPYNQPSFSNFVLRRLNEIGTVIQLTFSGSVSSIIPDSTERNALVQLWFKYKKTSDAASAYVTVDLTSELSVSGLYFTFQDLELLTLDANTSYNFIFYIEDMFGDMTLYELDVVLNQGTPLMSFRKRTTQNNRPRVGINNPEPYYELDVHGDISMRDMLVLGYVANLDDESLTSLKSGGYYVQANASAASTSLGYPAVKAGILEVFGAPGGAIIQRYTPLDATAVYIRAYSGSSWTSWKSHALS